MDLLEQEPLVLVTLEEFFLVGFFNKFTINMTLSTELEDGEYDEEEEQENSPKSDDKIVTTLKGLSMHMGWRQIFHLPEEMRHCYCPSPPKTL